MCAFSKRLALPVFLVFLSTQAWLCGRHLQAAAQAIAPPAVARAYFAGEDIYPGSAEAPGDLAHALAQAARENKRVILDFGGNWCPDCRVLDIYFRDPSNLTLLRKNFLIVHINVGRFDQNTDLAAKYGIPLQRGVPALAVLNSHGRLLYSQRNGEFEAMSRLDSSSVNQFLNTWKP